MNNELKRRNDGQVTRRGPSSTMVSQMGVLAESVIVDEQRLIATLVDSMGEYERIVSYEKITVYLEG